MTVASTDSPWDDADGRLEERIHAPWDKDTTDDDTKPEPVRKQSKYEERRRQNKPQRKD